MLRQSPQGPIHKTETPFLAFQHQFFGILTATLIGVLSAPF